MAIDEKKLKEDVKEYYSALKPQYISKLVEAVVEDIIDIIDEQPKLSLETKTSDKWIPCTERLPEKECLCLVTIKKKNGEYKVNTELYSYDNYGIGGFWTFDYIVAWMPLPEPYKGE